MFISLTALTDMLIQAAKSGDFDKVVPAERRRMVAVYRWVAAEIDPDKKPAPKSGVLLDLSTKTFSAHD